MSSPDLGRTFCDLVMKGGITSGVVYPSAIAGLSKGYRLRNIGGASAGAIAAGAAAAAEYRRQTDRARPMSGFDRLAGLGDELGRPPGGASTRHSRLFHLFAPTRLSRPVFSVLAGMLNRKSPWSRAGFGLLSLARAFPAAPAAGLALLVPALVPVAAGFTAGAPSALGDLRSPAGTAALVLDAVAILGFVLVVVVLLALWRSLRRFARAMGEQDFGLCTGMREPGSAGPPALTEWLHELLQAIADRPRDAPLTFGDLRRVAFPETPGENGIVLRMMTTCLTLGRPYTLPIRDRLYFDPAELGRYFPPEVVAWMKAHPGRGRGSEDADADARARSYGAGGPTRALLPIPEPDDFPVIVAVRMSLSFPILLSAIPLHRFTVRRDGDGPWEPTMERLVFTDGGVCSNLPIHLFDGPLPRWPTFALNLRDDLPAGSRELDRVMPPRRGRSYETDRYPVSRAPTLAATASFLAAIVKTMQNWRDMLQRAAPGARERVFTVRHTADEGGLNLDMKALAIDTMARSGALAADAVAAAFQAPPGTPPADDDWHHHRWVRLRLLLPVVREFLGRVATATGAPAAAPSFGDLLTASPPPLGRSYELNATSRAEGLALLEELARASERLAAAGADFERTAPRPAGELRVTPTF